MSYIFGLASWTRAGSRIWIQCSYTAGMLCFAQPAFGHTGSFICSHAIGHTDKGLPVPGALGYIRERRTISMFFLPIQRFIQKLFSSTSDFSCKNQFMYSWINAGGLIGLNVCKIELIGISWKCRIWQL